MTSVRIFDTTLRDGEQAPGCSMSTEEKVTVARQLARLGVDVIEAGFPAASPGDQDAVSAVAGAVGTPDGPVVCGLARATPEDIETCNAALAPAARRRIHTFLATSDLHLRHTLGMSGPRALETIAGARQVECTVNGIGERAGNAALEEVVMALATRRDRFLVESRVATRELFRASHLVARTVGLRVPPNKAVVGANAFAHESGIHQA